MKASEGSATKVPSNSKGSNIASPAHKSIGGPNKAGSKMKISDMRSTSSKR